MEQAGSKGKGDGSKPKKGEPEAPRRPRASAVVAVALAAGLLVWLLFIKGGDDDSSAPSPEATAPAAQEVALVPEAGLLVAMKGAGYPVYWAGPRVGVQYEVSRPEAGRTYVRYLPKGVEAGSERQFLTVGSYEQEDAIDSIRELGQKPGAILTQIAGGGSAYAEGPKATSAYLAFPGVNTQIEVFDPKAGEALRLIRSGAIVPVS
ncbi:MAG TPA: hypothetical protein VK480_04150 [Solirubrobacterales bacterium]|nr:hypothetical protein [Solirubrobacterales bacterium]